MKSTITINKELRKELEALKGSKTWEEFLKELLLIYKEVKKEMLKEKVKKLYDLVDIEKVEKGIKLRSYDSDRY